MWLVKENNMLTSVSEEAILKTENYPIFKTYCVKLHYMQKFY